MNIANQLPEPELGYIKTDKSNQPAFSARQMREAMSKALQPSTVNGGEPYGYLRHVSTTDDSPHGLAFRFAGRPGDIPVFTRHASAQVAQGAPATPEPVFQICKKDSQSIRSAWIDVDKRTYEDAGMFPEYGRRTLYTHPATSDDVVLDAGRYRYLRNRTPSDVLDTFGTSAGCWIDCEDDHGSLILLTGSDSDAAIDAAKEGTNGKIN